MSLLAWVDESERPPVDGRRAYLLGAVLAESVAVDGARDAMRSLLLPGQRKTHWRNESIQRRTAIIDAVAASDLRTIVVVHVGSTGERPRRRRHACMEAMVRELCLAGVTSAILESRDDRRDRDLLDGLRASRALSADLRFEHRAGPEDPLLWAADGVCGAVGAARAGDSSFVAALSGKLRVIDDGATTQ